MNNVKNIAALFALALLTTACGASNQSAIKAAPISVPAAAPRQQPLAKRQLRQRTQRLKRLQKAAETLKRSRQQRPVTMPSCLTQMLISTLFSSMLLSKTLLSTVRTCPCMSSAVAVQLFRCRRIRSTALVQWVSKITSTPQRYERFSHIRSSFALESAVTRFLMTPFFSLAHHFELGWSF